MHELSICHALVDQVRAVATDNHATAVHSITLGIGPLSGVEAHLLEQAWPIACAGTVSESAQLIIETLPLRVHCEQCDKQSDVKINKLICSHCGNWQTRLVSGDEMMLLSIELDRPDSINTQSSAQEANHV